MAEHASHGSAGGGGPGRSSGSGAGSKEGGDKELGGRMARRFRRGLQRYLKVLSMPQTLDIIYTNCSDDRDSHHNNGGSSHHLLDYGARTGVGIRMRVSD